MAGPQKERTAVEVEYFIVNDGCYDIVVPDGATDEEIKRAVLDDIREEKYLPEGANLEIEWEASDGRSGRLNHNIYPDVDEILRNNALDQCDSDDGEHEWAPRGNHNGLYYTGPKSYKVVYECTHCGLIRTYHYSVRRPGNPDFTVTFDWA
jgi:hypothetical protein